MALLVGFEEVVILIKVEYVDVSGIVVVILVGLMLADCCWALVCCEVDFKVDFDVEEVRTLVDVMVDNIGVVG